MAVLRYVSYVAKLDVHWFGQGRAFTEIDRSGKMKSMAKKAIIQTGGKQYIVTEGETLDIELIKGDSKSISFEPLMVIDGDKNTIGTPSVSGITVTADIINSDVQGDKVTSIRYKAKKRVHTVRGHRQRHTTIKVGKIA